MFMLAGTFAAAASVAPGRSLTAQGELAILTTLRRFDTSLRAHNKYG
jgi:hypothetical protein